MTAPRDGLEPRKYDPKDESPREAIANLAMTFRDLAAQSQRGAQRGTWPVGQTQFERWARRLENAVRILDAERRGSAPSGAP